MSGRHSCGSERPTTSHSICRWRSRPFTQKHHRFIRCGNWIAHWIKSARVSGYAREMRAAKAILSVQRFVGLSISLTRNAVSGNRVKLTHRRFAEDMRRLNVGRVFVCVHQHLERATHQRKTSELLKTILRNRTLTDSISTLSLRDRNGKVLNLVSQVRIN